MKRGLTVNGAENTIADSTAQHSTAQHSTAQHSTALVKCALFASHELEAFKIKYRIRDE